MKHEWEVLAWIVAFFLNLFLSFFGVYGKMDEVGYLLVIALPLLAWFGRIIYKETKISE